MWRVLIIAALLALPACTYSRSPDDMRNPSVTASQEAKDRAECEYEAAKHAEATQGVRVFAESRIYRACLKARGYQY